MISTLLSSAAAASLALRLVLFVRLHVVGRHYSVVRHAVSDYAVGPTAGLARVMTWVTGAGWLLLAGGLALADGLGGTGSTVTQLIALAAIFVVLPIVPTDVEHERTTLVGRLHLLLAVAWFALAYSVTGDLTRLLGGRGPHVVEVLLAPLRLVSGVGLIALVVSLLPRLRPVTFGISERVFLVAINVFFLAAAVVLALA